MTTSPACPLAARAGRFADAGHTASAVAEYGDALRSADAPADRTALHHNRGCVLRDAGRAAEALTDFDAALALAPDSVPTLEQRARCRMSLGDFTGAEADFDRALSLTPPTRAAGLYHARGALHVARKDFRAAVADYDFALAVRPDFTLAYLSRGHARYHLRDRAAADDYRTAFRLDPELAAREVARMAVADAMTQPDATLKNCRQHVRIDSTDALAHIRLGFTLRALGRAADADEAFATGRRLAPELSGHVADVLARM